MSTFEILGLAIGLAMDAFAIAVAVGGSLPEVTFRHYFRLSFHFGLFQFLMPIIGWFLGAPLVHAKFAMAEKGEPPAIGWIAAGHKAYGLLFAWGGFAVAPIAVGIFFTGTYQIDSSPNVVSCSVAVEPSTWGTIKAMWE